MSQRDHEQIPIALQALLRSLYQPPPIVADTLPVYRAQWFHGALPIQGASGIFWVAILRDCPQTNQSAPFWVIAPF